jgi:hypothetical protein
MDKLKGYYSIFVNDDEVERVWNYNRKQRKEAYKSWYEYTLENDKMDNRELKIKKSNHVIVLYT